MKFLKAESYLQGVGISLRDPEAAGTATATDGEALSAAANHITSQDLVGSGAFAFQPARGRGPSNSPPPQPPLRLLRLLSPRAATATAPSSAPSAASRHPVAISSPSRRPPLSLAQRSTFPTLSPHFLCSRLLLAANTTQLTAPAGLRPPPLGRAPPHPPAAPFCLRNGCEDRRAPSGGRREEGRPGEAQGGPETRGAGVRHGARGGRGGSP